MAALGNAADALLERQTLTGEELSDILARFPASQPPPELQSYIVGAPIPLKLWLVSLSLNIHKVVCGGS